MCAAPGARAGATVTVRRLPQARRCGCFTHIDPGRPEPSKERRENFTARLTIDVTPDFCGRINVAAFRPQIEKVLHAVDAIELGIDPADSARTTGSTSTINRALREKMPVPASSIFGPALREKTWGCNAAAARA